MWLRLAAPVSNGLDFFERDVQELEELLMIDGSGALELDVPAVHVGFGEPGGLHDGSPFLFGHVFIGSY